MSIDKNSAEQISLEEAKNLTHSFQENNSDAIKSFFVGTNKLNLILEQENCVGIRIYNGYDTQKKVKKLVMVGVDIQGEDMTSGVILDKFITCPKICPDSSVLIKTNC